MLLLSFLTDVCVASTVVSAVVALTAARCVRILVGCSPVIQIAMDSMMANFFLKTRRVGTIVHVLFLCIERG